MLRPLSRERGGGGGASPPLQFVPHRLQHDLLHRAFMVLDAMVVVLHNTHRMIRGVISSGVWSTGHGIVLFSGGNRVR